jgi:hypothetical protein
MIDEDTYPISDPVVHDQRGPLDEHLPDLTRIVMMMLLETYEIVAGDGVLIPHGELDVFVQVEKLELETLKCQN